MGVCNRSMFCCTLLQVHSSFAIILMGKRELVVLLGLSSWCLVIDVWLFLVVPWVCLQFVIVVFPDHTHLLHLVRSFTKVYVFGLERLVIHSTFLNIFIKPSNCDVILLQLCVGVSCLVLFLRRSYTYLCHFQFGNRFAEKKRAGCIAYNVCNFAIVCVCLMALSFAVIGGSVIVDFAGHIYLLLFVYFDTLRPSQHVSVMLGRITVYLG